MTHIHTYVSREYITKFCLLDTQIMPDIAHIIKYYLCIHAAEKSTEWHLRERAADIAERFAECKTIEIWRVPKHVFRYLSFEGSKYAAEILNIGGKYYYNFGRLGGLVIMDYHDYWRFTIILATFKTVINTSIAMTCDVYVY